MLIGSSPVSFVVLPFTIIAVTISMDQPSIPVGLIIFPVAFILTAVFPELNSFALSQAILCPLAVVNGTIIKFIWTSSN